MAARFDKFLGRVRDWACKVSDISDSGAVGRDLLRMSTPAETRAAIGVNSVAENNAIYAPLGLNLFSGGNFIENGLGEYVTPGQAVHNFPSCDADQSFVPQGAPISYALRDIASPTVVHKLLARDVAVPVGRLLEIGMNLTLGSANGADYSPTGWQYIALAGLDSDGNDIQDHMSGVVAGSALTTLAAPLSPGDTTITLTSAAGWQNAGNWFERQIIWWDWLADLGIYGYREVSGRVHAPYTYSRTAKQGFGGGYTGVWLAGGIAGNVITLNPSAFPSGWDGPALPAGTPVRNANGGGARMYFHAGQNMPAGHSKILKTMSSDPALSPDLLIYQGVAKVNIICLFNYDGVGTSDIRISSVFLRIKA